MKKIITLLTIILMLGNQVFAEELPTRENGLKYDLSNNPIYYEYVSDYANKLKCEFYKKRIGFNHQGTEYNYTVNRNGEIIKIKNGLPQDRWFNNRIKKVIMDNPPPPFKEGMDVEEMNYSVFLGNENYDDFDLYYSYIKKTFNIYIIKKY